MREPEIRMSSGISSCWYYPRMGLSREMAGDYKLFEGSLDFNTWLFRNITPTDSPSPERRSPAELAQAYTNHQAACRVPGTEEHTLPRPIVKSPEPGPREQDQWSGYRSTDLSSSSCITSSSIATTTGITGVPTASSTSSLQGSPTLSVRGRSRSLSCSSGGSDGGGQVQCVFCKRNGETREFFSTHTLKDWRGIVVCPVLRAYTCPRCGSSGDYAHTESHCPLYGHQPSLMASLRTRRSSCGFRVKYTHR